MNTACQIVVREDDASPSAPPGDGDDSPPAERTDARRIDVTSQADADDPLFVKQLADRGGAVCDALGLIDWDLSVVLVDDAHMASLHERFAGVSGTTDVLTFDLRDAGERLNRVEGEVYVCIDVARRQAASRGHTLGDELLLYLLHGVLHLMGYDDHDDEAYAAMHQREDEVLEQIGVGRVFDRGERGA